MFFEVTKVLVDYGEDTLIESRNPVFTWTAVHEQPDERQTACRVEVWHDFRQIWSSGWVETAEPRLRYDGPALESLCGYTARVALRDREGRESGENFSLFTTPLYEPWSAKWIAAPEDREGCAPYFRRVFSGKGVQRAVLCCCGLGYQSVTINGEPVSDSFLAPIVSDYTRTCYYTVCDVTDLLEQEDNCIGVILGDGWRRNLGEFLGNNLTAGAARFYGQPQLTAFLRLFKATGGYVDIPTDEKWTCGYGGYTNNLFDGETFDARLHPVDFDTVDFDGEGFGSVRIVPAPGAAGCFLPDWLKDNEQARRLSAPHTPVMRPQLVPEIRWKGDISPVSIYTVRPDVQIIDFGREIAGIAGILLPPMKEGQRVSIQFAEELNEEGGLYLDNLRGAKCTDTFISNGQNDEYDVWQPRFTYHGFRYAAVTGYPEPLNTEKIWASVLYTDVDVHSFFRCGSANANALHEICVATERANLHGIATDCPQRDERMGWMNDATVRFEETPYSFDIGRLFPKIVQDIMDTQDENGAITCTAPFVYGGRPADPVCSSFLVAAQQALLFGGDRETVARAYDSFAAWTECLRRTGGDSWTVGYTYYGDWAGPADACRSMEDARSSSVDGLLMSTGYLYFNYTLLAQFARVLGKEDDAARFDECAAHVRDALLARWYHPETCTLDTGSQSAQAFGLWLRVIPEADRACAAERMKDAVVDAGMRLTTGNLCTRYLMDMLAEYGYTDVAWALIQRQEYPSWGYMMQNAATTVWERFELKQNGGMNSHCHPMYGAVDRWFYSHLLGIRPAAEGCAAFEVEPHMPAGLLYAEGTVDTPRGEISVRWHKKYGKTYVSVNVPFNASATVRLPDGSVHEQGSGYKMYAY